MLMKFNFLPLFVCLICTTCAWNKDSILNIEVEGDLVDSFSLESKKFQKFKEEAPSEEAEKKEEKKELLVEVEEKILETKNEKVQKKIVIKKRPKPQIVSSQRFRYPKGYPELLKKYDKISEKVWKKFQPTYSVGETFVMDVKYLGITAGKVTIKTLPKTMIGGKLAYHYLAKIKSAPFYKLIYSLDDYVETFVDVDSHLPIKYSLVQRESGQNVDDLQLFDLDNLKTFFWYKRHKRGVLTKREKEAFIPRFVQDSFSALFFARGLPLKIGDVYQFPVVTRTKVWILKMEVFKRETIKLNGTEHKAIQIKAETHYPGVLKKRGDIFFWYSDGPLKNLLKFRAKVKIGSVEGDLVHYSNESM